MRTRSISLRCTSPRFSKQRCAGKSGYIPLFRDYRAAPGWLPETIYLNQFQDSSYQLVSTYEEDMNAATTTMSGGLQSGQNLTVWREQAVELVISPIIWADRYERRVSRLEC